MIPREKDIDLLYIEDNKDYLDFVSMAVRKVDTTLNFQSVSDSTRASKMLDDPGKGNIIKKARVILLDYYMPGCTGIELLQQIRSYPEMKHTPVIMFSTSDNPEDIREAYVNGASAYLLKPTGMNSLRDTIRLVCEFWLSKNQFAQVATISPFLVSTG